MLCHPFADEDQTEDDGGKSKCQHLTSKDVADSPNASAHHLDNDADAHLRVLFSCVPSCPRILGQKSCDTDGMTDHIAHCYFSVVIPA